MLSNFSACFQKLTRPASKGTILQTYLKRTMNNAEQKCWKRKGIFTRFHKKPFSKKDPPNSGEKMAHLFLASIASPVKVRENLCELALAVVFFPFNILRVLRKRAECPAEGLVRPPSHRDRERTNPPPGASSMDGWEGVGREAAVSIDPMSIGRRSAGRRLRR